MCILYMFQRFLIILQRLNVDKCVTFFFNSCIGCRKFFLTWFLVMVLDSHFNCQKYFFRWRLVHFSMLSTAENSQISYSVVTYSICFDINFFWKMSHFSKSIFQKLFHFLMFGSDLDNEFENVNLYFFDSCSAS